MKQPFGQCLLACLLLCIGAGSGAVELRLTPADDLQWALDQAAPGDRLRLEPGIYRGNYRISRRVEIDGQSAAVFDAGGRGHALRISAGGVILRNLQIRNWGENLTNLDAGIFVEKGANGIQIIANRLKGGGFGIWLDGVDNARVVGNRIEGDSALRSVDRGNGIHLSSVTGSLIQDNEIWHARDGLYIESSSHNRLTGNYLHDLRYGVHYMYAHDNEVSYNHTRDTRTGYALMQSKRLTVTHNRSEGDRNYGLLMNFITQSRIAHNRIEGVRSGRASTLANGSSTAVSGAEGKALFIYNSLYNQVEENLLADSDLGIHLTAGSEDNAFTGNAFIDNKTQVKYVATRRQEWSRQGRGNYWSDYLGWDMDGDGIGDTHYQPNDAVDKLLWKYPAARVLMNSPAVETLRWVQRQFPVLRPPGVTDSHPLMRSPYPTTRTDTMPVADRNAL